MAIISIICFLFGIAFMFISALAGLTHGTNPSTITFLDSLSITSFVLSFISLMTYFYGRK